MLIADEVINEIYSLEAKAQVKALETAMATHPFLKIVWLMGWMAGYDRATKLALPRDCPDAQTWKQTVNRQGPTLASAAGSNSKDPSHPHECAGSVTK